MNKAESLEINSGLWLEYVPYMGVFISYMEYSPDYWYSDRQTDVEVDKETAEKIIAFLNKLVLDVSKTTAETSKEIKD